MILQTSFAPNTPGADGTNRNDPRFAMERQFSEAQRHTNGTDSGMTSEQLKRQHEVREMGLPVGTSHLTGRFRRGGAVSIILPIALAAL